MLDHLDLCAVGNQRCASRHFDPLMNVGGNSPHGFEVAANKDDAGGWPGRPKLDVDVAAAPKTKPRHCTRASKRSLVSQGCRQGCFASRFAFESAAGGIAGPQFCYRSDK